MAMMRKEFMELNHERKYDYEENGEKKAFLANPKHQYRVPQCG